MTRHQHKPRTGTLLAILTIVLTTLALPTTGAQEDAWPAPIVDPPRGAPWVVTNPSFENGLEPWSGGGNCSWCGTPDEGTAIKTASTEWASQGGASAKFDWAPFFEMHPNLRECGAGWGDHLSQSTFVPFEAKTMLVDVNITYDLARLEACDHDYVVDAYLDLCLRPAGPCTFDATPHMLYTRPDGIIAGTTFPGTYTLSVSTHHWLGLDFNGLPAIVTLYANGQDGALVYYDNLRYLDANGNALE